MKISNDVKQRIYHVLSITLFATILTSTLNVLYGFQVNDFLIFAIAVISMVLLYMVRHHSRIFLVLLFSVLIVIGAFLIIKKIPILLRIDQMWNWLLNYVNGSNEANSRYVAILIIIIHVLVCIIATLVCKQNVVKYCSFIGMFIAMIVMSLTGFSCTRMQVAYIILGNLIMLVEIRCNQMEASKEKKQLAAFNLLPICLVIVSCVLLIPTREEPIRWTGIRKAISMIQEKGELLSERIRLYLDGKDGSFEMSFAGYSDDDSDLGGEVGANDKIALKIKPSTTDYPGYLVGSVKNIYTGSGWKTETTKITDDSSEYMNDLFEFACALSRYPERDLEKNNLFKYENFEIFYENIKTVTKFYPLKTCRFVQSEEFIEKTDRYANIRFKNIKGDGTNYLAFYYRLNLDSGFLKQILRDSDEFIYEEFASTVDKNELRSWAWDTFQHGEIKWGTLNVEQLQARRDRIYKDYVSLPETLPDRVYDLANEITKGLTTDYDKMKAIERYLNSLTYTTKTITPEKGKDFVDSFLFEQKEGYCTYFASSMAVMGRCLGIPTRYVEGFYVDYEDKEDSYYVVKNSDAHAWVEVYFDGVGWIPFEPTPGYVEKLYKEWKPISKGENSSYQSTNPYPSQNYQPPESVQQQPNKVEIVKKEVKINTDIVFIIVGILGIIVILFLIYYMTTRHKMRRRYNQSDNATKAVVIYRRIMYHLVKIGLPYSSTETLQIYATRMDEYIPISPYTFSKVNDLYMSIRYGDYAISDEQLDMILAYEKEFYEYLKNTYGRMRIRCLQWKLNITYKKLY